MRYPFEELPDFWDGEFRSGAHNGCAEISYAPSGGPCARSRSIATTAKSVRLHKADDSAIARLSRRAVGSVV